MALRCFLFSSDEGTVAILRQILTGLDVDAESCSNAVTAAEKITNQSFQIVIIDWDHQPEAGLLLSTARERKAAERPLTLAIVSDDASGPQALQAGANSLLRKPLGATQAKETLITARDLLRAKQGVAAPQSAAAAAAASSTATSIPVSDEVAPPPVKSGFLQSSASVPGTLLEAELKAPRRPATPAPSTDEQKETESPSNRKEEHEKQEEEDSSEQNSEGRGLQWYLKKRVASQPPKTSEPAPSRGNPELIGYDQTPSQSSPQPSPAKRADTRTVVSISEPFIEPKKESTFTNPVPRRIIAPDVTSPENSGLKKRAIAGALVLAGIAIAIAPQAPWHSKLQALWRGGKQSVHAWLYPQPVTPAVAPTAHESFTRAGDEYKLPVPETIPDATTDPSQIKVLPVIDPTLKKANGESGTPDPTAQPDSGSGPADVPSQVQPAPIQPNQTPSAAPSAPQTSVAAPLTSHPAAPAGSAVADPTIHPAVQPVTPPSSPAPRPVQTRAPSMPANVPQSLRSQLTSMTPESSGNKAPETALPSIEPVNVSEAQERALLTDQAAPAYPPSAKGQQGTVTLQVLIGRDGTVQDAKFLQGSLVFARSAIDTVKQWKFKPYMMNTRPVSVQTQFTIKFKPGE